MATKGQVLCVAEEGTKGLSKAAAVHGASQAFGTKNLQLPNLTANCIPRELIRHQTLCFFRWLYQAISMVGGTGGGWLYKANIVLCRLVVRV